MIRITGIHIAALDIRRIVRAPTWCVDAPMVSAGFGMETDTICRPAAGAQVVFIGTMAVEAVGYLS